MPSDRTAANELRGTATDLQDGLATGLEDLPPWVVCGIPDLAVVDNGMDLRAKNVVAAFHALGIDLVYAPPRVPWYKGVIERFGCTLNTRFVHWLPGTTLGKQTGDLGYDGKKLAVFTFNVFEQLLQAYFRLIHNRTPRREREYSPVTRFIRGTSQWPVRMPLSQDEFDAAVALTARATLQQTGLWYQGLQYQCDELGHLWNRVPAGTQLTIKVNPLDLHHIKVLRPISEEIISVSCVTPIEWPRSLAFHLAVRAHARKLGADPDDLRALVQAEVAMRQLIAQAMRASKRAIRRLQAELFRQSQRTDATSAPNLEAVQAAAKEEDLVDALSQFFNPKVNK